MKPTRRVTELIVVCAIAAHQPAFVVGWNRATYVISGRSGFPNSPPQKDHRSAERLTKAEDHAKYLLGRFGLRGARMEPIRAGFSEHDFSAARADPDVDGPTFAGRRKEQ